MSINRIRVSPNFVLSEFQCRCCKAVKLHQRVLAILQLIREHYGRPLQVTSAYRCPKHNAAIGGAKDSDHLKGMAVDVAVPRRVGVEEMARTAKRFGATRTGIYESKRFVHVSIRRKKPAQWYG